MAPTPIIKRASADGEPTVYADTLTTEEAFKLVALAESTIGQSNREGYNVTLQGSCAKGPQGIWWELTIEFESEQERDAFFEFALREEPT